MGKKKRYEPTAKPRSRKPSLPKIIDAEWRELDDIKDDSGVINAIIPTRHSPLASQQSAALGYPQQQPNFTIEGIEELTQAVKENTVAQKQASRAAGPKPGLPYSGAGGGRKPPTGGPTAAPGDEEPLDDFQQAAVAGKGYYQAISEEHKRRGDIRRAIRRAREAEAEAWAAEYRRGRPLLQRVGTPFKWLGKRAWGLTKGLGRALFGGEIRSKISTSLIAAVGTYAGGALDYNVTKKEAFLRSLPQAAGELVKWGAYTAARAKDIGEYTALEIGHVVGSTTAKAIIGMSQKTLDRIAITKQTMHEIFNPLAAAGVKIPDKTRKRIAALSELRAQRIVDDREANIHAIEAVSKEDLAAVKKKYNKAVANAQIKAAEAVNIGAISRSYKLGIIKKEDEDND